MRLEVPLNHSEHDEDWESSERVISSHVMTEIGPRLAKASSGKHLRSRWT